MTAGRRPVAPRAGRASGAQEVGAGSGRERHVDEELPRVAGDGPRTGSARAGSTSAPRRGAGAPASPPAGASPRRTSRGAAASLPAPRGLTRRAAALAVLLLVVAAALAPYLHASISQRAEIASARAELSATRDDVEDLELQLSRWEDPAFVEREARDRLALVMPGDELYRVVGVSPSQQAALDPRAAAADEVRGVQQRPWFGVLWDSVGSAGLEASGR
ncbi:septum formation initiator family protein [uncultured Pseudokineococcus sp.]|uniref:septum formation initiator family protein n=1 Tax=uncultured Pseudokineococcus sp. TaxID=1642928 RepID=UPI0026251908|nr:septum formation initiator family protein [uncultured Pseudokineococcus sp.]